MAITKANYSRSWVVGRNVNLRAQLYSCGEALINSGIFPSFSAKKLLLTGSIQSVGNFEEVRNETESIPDDEFESGQLDLHSGVKPPARPVARIIVTVTFPYRQLKLQIVNPSDEIVSNAFSIVRKCFPPHDPASVTDDPIFPPVGGRALRKDAVIDAYRILTRLGSGQSGEVWTAEVVRPPQGVNLTKGSIVAMKHYSGAFLSSADLIRVQREFLIASELDHPHLVKVHDLVLSPSRPFHSFLVMDYIKGKTLKDSIPRSGMPVKVIVEYAKQLFSALEALHARRALHRDVKAANILIAANDGSLKLLDLGIVSVVGDASLTATSVFIGSKHSAPYEQLTGEELDHRSDIYSVGTVMYHCYNGTPIYHKVGPEGAIVAKMLSNPAKLTVKKDQDNDKPFIDFVNHCLEFDPASRPSNARTCMETLESMKFT